MKKVIGIDIGGTKISSGIFDNEGKLLHVVTVPTMANKAKEIVINQIQTSIQKLFNKNNSSLDSIVGIGVCCPGPLNPKTGFIYNPPNLPTMWNINLKDILEDIYKVPVLIENDANAAAYAETIIGAAKGFENVFYVTISTGIGTGIIINKKIYHGKNGFAGEGGHVSTNYRGIIGCNCGTAACIESLASGTAIANKARELIEKPTTANSMLKQFSDCIEKLSAKDVSNFASQGDELSKSLLLSAAYNIGAWLGGMINLLDPEAIVIGGGLSNSGDFFFDMIKQTALKFTYNPFANQTPVFKASLNVNTGVYGAASLFLF